ncbi:MAG: cupin domain-containing protein [Candidatus Sumerlaeota bacterium]|nr:cupin domain-containing protein [Candidatus Sumerlaeota bacterium]
MFAQQTPEGYEEALPGVRRRTLVFGEKTLMTEFRLERGSLLPEHAHLYEQTGYLVSGRIVLKIGEASYEASPGDSWCILMNVIHGVQIIEDAVAIEVFSPARQDYLPADEGGRA